MSNKNYAQVADMLAQAQLRWVTDSINALMVTNVAYDETHKRFSEVGATSLARSPIQGRSVALGGLAMGLPATFSSAESDTEYQVLVVKDDGTGDPLVLSYIDQDQQGEPLSVLRSGTMIVRPYLMSEPTEEDQAPSPTVGVWMVLA